MKGRRPFWSLTSTPSNVTFDWSLCAPLTEPLRISPRRCESSGSALRKVTPACRDSRPAGLRAFKGSWRMGFVPNAWSTDASVVLIRAAAAETVTASTTAATASKTTAHVALVLTRPSKPSTTTSAKPSLLAARM